ncbi:hypothetical protein [Janibacter sp. GS2]|uniref:hypothetical protein n=1 Tax=Janibacter sp. GS2 TaxID=3442646 RepID=UPI003EC07D13
MPWLKMSDRFATHPIWARLRGVRRADERTVNEVIGFVTRCATQASGHMTDYYVDLETAEMMGKARTDVLLRQAVTAGMLTAEGKGAARRWRIVEDEDLWQMRARDDVLWERQRDRDRKNPDLTMPVLARDGDVCRYCGVVVNWKDTRSGRGGTFDHRTPGEEATVDTYVVACRTDNSKRLNNPHADEDTPLRPPPALPYFSSASSTLARLEKFYGRPIPHVDTKQPTSDTAAPPRPGTQPDTAPRDPAPSRTPRSRPGTQSDTALSPRPEMDAGESTRDTAATATTSATGGDTAAKATTPVWGGDTAASAATPAPSWAERPPDHCGTTPGTAVVEGWSPGTGRDGDGSRSGSGRDGTGAAPAPEKKKPRARRGKS